MDRAAANGTPAIALRLLESSALTGRWQPHPTSALARHPSDEFTPDALRALSLDMLIRDGQALTQAPTRFALDDAKMGASTGASLSQADLARREQLYRSDLALCQPVPGGRSIDAQ